MPANLSSAEQSRCPEAGPTRLFCHTEGADMTMRQGGRAATIVHRRAPRREVPAGVNAGNGAAKLWASIPKELADKVRPVSGLLVQDAIREIQKAVPAYRQPLQGKFREVLVGAVEMAIIKCFDNICEPDADQADWQAVFRYT